MMRVNNITLLRCLLLTYFSGLFQAAAFVGREQFQAFPNKNVQPSLSKTTASSQLHATATTLTEEKEKTEELARQKKALLGLIRSSSSTAVKDPVLADPITKEPLEVSVPGVLLGGTTSSKKNVKYNIKSSTNAYAGSSDTFIDLLEPTTTTGNDQNDNNVNDQNNNRLLKDAVKQVLPLIPVPLRRQIATLTDGEFIPMRDLFTSPSVSFAYERGWRQGFARAGFPGPDLEAEMAMDYFAPVISSQKQPVLVDMSCATGLFTRRFALSKKYSRVLGCDYSESMLSEARRRIQSDPEIQQQLSATSDVQLDLIRLDVGQIPMQSESIDVLHAGAAMHCWPDLDMAISEIYRVLKPGGRYFATTFLSSYFGLLISDNETEPTRQAFQIFDSVDKLRVLLERNGFESSKLSIEVVGPACVVIRGEK